MDWKCEDVIDATLRPAKCREDFELHMAALEWSLIDPIIINSEADIKATNWRDRGLKPFHHQIQNLITFCRRLPIALIADDVGLGKTISAGLILSELLSRKRVNRTLVIGPKVLMEQWVGELDQKFGITAKAALGKDLDAELRRNTPVVVTTYHSASARLAGLEPGQFDFCIFDEAHKLRNLHGSQVPPKMAENVRASLLRRPFKYVVMLTATPIQNKIWDLYSLIDLLKVAEGKPNPLGTPADFQKQYIQPGSNGRKLQAAKAGSFQNQVRPNLSRTRRTDARLPFPERRSNTIRLPLAGAESDMIGLVGQNIAHLNPLAQTSLSQALMSSPRALVQQAENMGNSGSLDASVARQFRAMAARVAVPAKLARLLALLEELRGERGSTWRAVVFTVRRETQEMIGETLRARGIAVGFIRGADEVGNRQSIAGYDADPPTVNLIVSTDAGAEGINLQKGNVLINYDLPWNPMIVEQRIGRVQRLGSEFQYVVIVNLVGAGTVEDRVVARLLEKLHGVSQTFGDIEGILEAADFDEEGGKSFESRMRKMVVDALQGKDIDASQRLIDASIASGSKLFDEGKHLLDSALGLSPADAVSHRPPPKIERHEPRMDYREFVLGAKRADGWTVREIDPTRAEAIAPGRVLERIRFSDDSIAESPRPIFAESPSRSYLPGKPAFERLVQHWVDHNAHRIADGKSGASEDATEHAKVWCRSFSGCEFVTAIYTPNRSAFQGRLHIKVTAGTGVDKFEKLLPATVAPKGHGPVETTARGGGIGQDVRIKELLPQYDALVKSVVEGDAEVSLFCDYYLGRLRESLMPAVRDAHLPHKLIDPHLRAKVEGDFRPYVQAEVVALDGVSYDYGIVRIGYKIDGVEYRSELTLIPATRQWLAGLERERCAVTAAVWPIASLGTCAETNRRALRHRLVTTANGDTVLPDHVGTCFVSNERHRLRDLAASAVSGRIALRSKLFECQESKDLILWEEAGVSDFSDRLVRKDLLRKSDKAPHRKGVHCEFGVCEETHRRLLKDELAATASGRLVDRALLRPSVRTGRFGLPSEMVTCEASNVELLADETGLCVLTGKRVDGTLLKPSSVSGLLALAELLVGCPITKKLALPSELHVCEITGTRAIPDTMGTCSVTGTRAILSQLGECEKLHKVMLKSLLGVSHFSGMVVEQGLLVQSEKSPHRSGLIEETGRCESTKRRLLRDELGVSSVSKKVVALDLLVQSEASQDLALPEEMETCERSRKRVLPIELGTCCITRLRVLRTELERSDLSDRWALREHTIRLRNSRTAIADETVRCAWLNIPIAESESGRCGLTRQIVSTTFLNGDGQLAPLAELLDGIAGGASTDPILIPSLRHLDRDLAGLSNFLQVRSPGGNRAILCEVHSRSWFRTKVRYYGLLIRATGAGIEAVGCGVGGYRDADGEFVIDQEDLLFG